MKLFPINNNSNIIAFIASTRSPNRGTCCGLQLFFLFRWTSCSGPNFPRYLKCTLCMLLDCHSLALLLCTYMVVFICRELSVGETMHMAVAVRSVHFTICSYRRKLLFSWKLLLAPSLAASASGSAWLDGRQYCRCLPLSHTQVGSLHSWSKTVFG